MPNLVTLLALCTPTEPFEGMAEVTAACDPGSLAAFGWSLFQQSMLHRDDTGGWTLGALGALGVVGDDETVRRLTAVLLGLPHGDDRWKIVTGVAVLAAIGTEVALENLARIAEQSPFRSVRAAGGRQRDALREIRGSCG